MDKMYKHLMDITEKRAKPYLGANAVMGSIGNVVKKNEHLLQTTHKASLIGETYEENGKTYIKDVLDEEHKTYEVITDDEMIEMNRRGDLPASSYIFCYSLYEPSQFKEILLMGTPEEITEYLIRYNIQNKTTIYWTFLDDEKRRELDKIAEENTKNYHMNY